MVLLFFFTVGNFATRQFSRNVPDGRFFARSYPASDVRSIDSFQRKAIYLTGYTCQSRGLPNGIPNFVIYLRAAALRDVLACAAWMQARYCVRCASVTTALCARNNRCIIRFQSGLGVICIDLLSTHLFGDCGHVLALNGRSPRSIRV